MLRLSSLLAFLLIVPSLGSWAVADQPPMSGATATAFLHQYCIDCHDANTQEGGVALDELSDVTIDNAELWKTVWEQVALKEMPPAEELQPDPILRWKLSTWITAELQRAMKDHGGFETHRHPTKGNHLDHDLLFGEIPDWIEPTSTPARLWRLHPQEHLTRLNALITREPDYDPKRPGLRTRGDHINPNLDGEVKVYYGLDRVIGWVGGTAAYAAAITGFPPMLTTENHHGLRNYANLYSVNGSEATQIANTAEDILRFMAYGPDAEPYQFADKVGQIDKKYKHGDLRGLAQSLFYGKSPKRPITPVHDLMAKEKDTQQDRIAAVNYLFEALTCRPPSDAETAEYLGLLNDAIADLGKKEGALLGLTPIFLDRDALFRPELAEYGTPDQYGRVLLQDQELALAINAAFSYIPPDEALQQAVADGRLKTRQDAKREIERILADDSIRKPRVLQFFREFFDYDRAGHVCKDNKALISAGGEFNAEKHYRAMFAMTANTDRLIELILQEDKNVLGELLTTDRVVYNAPQDAPYFGQFISSDPPPKPKAVEGKKTARQMRRVTIQNAKLPKGETIHARVAQVVKPLNTARTLTTLPPDQRRGILTHPSWLVAHTDAMDNHAILRGRWIRERLLGDAVPDVPITVDAMLPVEPKSTLRHRMRVTRADECWRCHRKMDPLGLPFEMYNHLGLYRTEEQKKPVDTSGAISDSGDPEIDGPVENALEMIDRLATSQRVQQVFVRHAFRFWMGRNETVHDAPVLQDAYQAYQESGGSMKALLASLLTSDAYLYRTVDRAGETTTRQQQRGGS
ncbi:Planctomycete cytochrome C [Rosistilla ulvae]|uniref:Planctomycete cytochrome C n=2 Tax=Rosistilla ulvae TaxID=1930277 RepID=A0A517M278_9BACT|nr:Planctomycete cytochrome C [Rosistilla ulvae]